MDRTELISILQSIEPGLSNREIRPVLSCFCFREGSVYASDDMVSLVAPFETQHPGGIRGRPLLQWLQTMSAREAVISQEADNFTVKAGRTKLKLPIIPEEDFLFDVPDIGEAAVWEIGEAELDYMRRAAISMGTNSDHEWRYGLTIYFEELEPEGHDVVAYASDDLTIVRAYCGTTAPEGSRSFKMPPRFVEILLSSCKTKATLYIEEGWVAADLENGVELYGRSVGRPDMKTFEEFCGGIDDLREEAVTLPKRFDAMLARAEILLGNERNPFSKLDITDGRLLLFTESDLGDGRDLEKLRGAHPDVEVMIAPALVRRGLEYVTDVRVFNADGEAKIYLFGEGFDHIVAVGQEG